jgi:serine protease
MFSPALLLSAAFISGNALADLRVSADAPPTRVQGEEDIWQFGVVPLRVLPGVVLHLSPNVAPPPGAVSLGGRSWRLPTDDAQHAIELALDLAQSPGVVAFPDVSLPVRRHGIEFDDPEREGQWYLDSLEMDALYEVSLGDPDSRVAVLDSGIDIAHPDLVDAVDLPYDAFSDDLDPSPNPGEYCGSSSDAICDEHGTAVSGVIAARANNGTHIVGMCPECTLIPVKLLGEPQMGSLTENVRAFEHAIAAEAGVINNSWGFTSSIAVPEPLAEVIRRAATEPRGGLGALVVFAAGNDDREIDDDEMQAMPEVLCVSATDSYGRYTNYTNEGASVDVAAPSATVTIAPEGGMTTTFGGTSAAAPVVSGLASWALSVRPDLSAEELKALIIDTAVPSPLVTHDENGHHPIYGYGEIDPAGLMLALLGEPETDNTDETAQPDESKGGCSTLPAGGGWAAGLVLLLGLSRRRAH